MPSRCFGDRLQDPDQPASDPATCLTCHHPTISASSASTSFRGTRSAKASRNTATSCTGTSIALCAVFSTAPTAFPPCRAPHHPSSFSPSDRTGAFQQSVHCSRPVEGPFPLFQLRNHDSRHSVAKLDLLYTPFTWSTPLHFGGAWRVHHVIHLMRDIHHATSDHARRGGRHLLRPLLPAPSPDSGPSRPPGAKTAHSGRGYVPVALSRQWHKMARSKLRLVPADRTRPFHKVFTDYHPIGGRCATMYHRFSYEMSHLVHSGTKPAFLHTPNTAWKFSASTDLAGGYPARPCAQHRQPTAERGPHWEPSAGPCPGRSGPDYHQRRRPVTSVSVSVFEGRNAPPLQSPFRGPNVIETPLRPARRCHFPRLAMSLQSGTP